jgi:dihydroorotase
MEFARSLSIPVIDHCEDLHLSAGGDMHEGLESVRLGLRGIPGCSEDVMVARDILLAEVTGAHYHVAHISARRSVEMVGFAKSRGMNVTAETTPHHFALADAHMLPYDSNYKMKPPLRSECDVGAVVTGVVNGSIDAIATDHAPHPAARRCRSLRSARSGLSAWKRRLGSRWSNWSIRERSGCGDWSSCSPPVPRGFCAWTAARSLPTHPAT